MYEYDEVLPHFREHFPEGVVYVYAGYGTLDSIRGLRTCAANLVKFRVGYDMCPWRLDADQKVVPPYLDVDTDGGRMSTLNPAWVSALIELVWGVTPEVKYFILVRRAPPEELHTSPWVYIKDCIDTPPGESPFYRR